MAEEVATAEPALEPSGSGHDGAGHNGSSHGSGSGRGVPPPAPPGRNTSIKPALLVAGIAVGLMAVFIVFSAVSGNGGSGTPTSNSTGGGSSAVSGTTLRAMPATNGLRPIEQPGSPPNNVLAAITLPTGSVRVAHNTNQAGQYDEQVTFSVPASQTSVFSFYKTEMHRAGWNVSNAGPASDPRSVEVLGKLAGDDGWYWEMGATISPTRFASTAAGPGTGAESTRFTIRLFQVPDDGS